MDFSTSNWSLWIQFLSQLAIIFYSSIVVIFVSDLTMALELESLSG